MILSKMVESMIHFLVKVEDKEKILAKPESLCALLQQIVEYEAIFRDDR